MSAEPRAAGASPSDTPPDPCAETHFAGVLVQARAERLPDICLAISLLPRAEVTHQGEDGRLVAVLEAGSGRAIAQQMEAIRMLPGVVNVALVYQHAEFEDELNKEMPA